MGESIFTEIERPQKQDYNELIEVWEASVRATHHFLPEADIRYFKPLILSQYFDAVKLYCIRHQNKIAGFLGVSLTKIEMLFIHPDYMRKGIGKKLLLHAVENLKLQLVDVNEQNPQARGFYEHFGFKMIGRSALDGNGKPYPLLHMQLM